ncbi:MAG: tetratricopeptide repeat protein [Candidatus Sulfomarinibacteraceae bacterium]
MKSRSRTIRFILALSLIVACFSTAGASPAPKKNKKKQHVDALAAQSMMRQGYVFMQQQRYTEALERFAEADKANPGNATVYNMMGLCYLSMEQFDKALQHFDTALELIPGFTDARNNRGSTYLSLKQYRMAEVDFIAVLSDSTYPHRWKVYYNLGVTYLSSGQIGAAEENFRKAITSATPVFEAYLRLAEIAQSQGRIESALGLLEEARLKYPERLDGILAYGRLLIDAGRPAEARPYLEDVIASDPASPMAGEARILLGET